MGVSYKEKIIHSIFDNQPLVIKVKYGVFDVEMIQAFQNKENTLSYCVKGCPNYGKNWSCPPHSPGFAEYSSGFPFLFLMVYIAEIPSMKINKKDVFSTSYDHIKQMSNKKLVALEKNSDGKMIPGNACEICKTCTIHQKESCIFPDRLRFNFTSLGMRMDLLSQSVFNHSLDWQATGKIPGYVSCFGGLLIKNDTDGLNSFI